MMTTFFFNEQKGNEVLSVYQLQDLRDFNEKSSVTKPENQITLVYKKGITSPFSTA